MYTDDTVITLADKSLKALNRQATTTLKKTKKILARQWTGTKWKNRPNQLHHQKNREMPLTLPGIELENKTKYLRLVVYRRLKAFMEVAHRLSLQETLLRHLCHQTINARQWRRSSKNGLSSSYWITPQVWGGTGQQQSCCWKVCSKWRRIVRHQKRAITNN